MANAAEGAALFSLNAPLMVAAVMVGLLVPGAPGADRAAIQDTSPALFEAVAQEMAACLTVQGHEAQVVVEPTASRIVLDGWWVMTVDDGPPDPLLDRGGRQMTLETDARFGPLVLHWEQSLFEYPAAVRHWDAACFQTAVATVRRWLDSLAFTE